LEIDDKLNLDRLHDGKLRRLRPLKDAACIDATDGTYLQRRFHNS
jgi:hypothetical protein